MAIADRVPPPVWVEAAPKASGLDHLGLRLPVQTLGGQLLNGITTITPTARYHSIRTWLLHTYLNATPRRPDRLSDFLAYAAHAECAVALGNLLVGTPALASVVGRDGARPLVLEDPDVYPLRPLTKIAASTIYSQPAEQLDLSRGRDPGVPTLGEEWGVPLARAADASLSATAIGKRLRAGVPIETATREEIEEFGNATWLDEVPPAERDALLAAVLPREPRDRYELNRLATYAVLLTLGQLDGDATQDGVFEEAARPRRRVPHELGPILDGWLLYAVRDSIAVSAEYTLDAVHRTVLSLDPADTGVDEAVVVRALLETGLAETRRLLGEFGLAQSKQIHTVRLSEISAALAERTRTVSRSGGGERWSGGLDELALMAAAESSLDAAPLLGLLSWLHAERRAGSAVREQMREVELLSYDGEARFGMAQVILPRLDAWRSADARLVDALAEYVHIVIEQHLHITWTRYAEATSPRETSLLVRDGERLTQRLEFAPGRTAARLQQAIWWLVQLGLLDGEPTREGSSVLERILATLRSGANP